MGNNVEDEGMWQRSDGVTEIFKCHPHLGLKNNKQNFIFNASRDWKPMEMLGEFILKKSYNVLPLLIKQPGFITCEFGFDPNGWSINCSEFGCVNEFLLFFESTEYCNL